MGHFVLRTLAALLMLLAITLPAPAASAATHSTDLSIVQDYWMCDVSSMTAVNGQAPTRADMINAILGSVSSDAIKLWQAVDTSTDTSVRVMYLVASMPIGGYVLSAYSANPKTTATIVYYPAANSLVNPLTAGLSPLPVSMGSAVAFAPKSPAATIFATASGVPDGATPVWDVATENDVTATNSPPYTVGNEHVAVPSTSSLHPTDVLAHTTSTTPSPNSTATAAMGAGYTSAVMSISPSGSVGTAFTVNAMPINTAAMLVPTNTASLNLGQDVFANTTNAAATTITVVVSQLALSVANTAVASSAGFPTNAAEATTSAATTSPAAMEVTAHSGNTVPTIVG